MYTTTQMLTPYRWSRRWPKWIIVHTPEAGDSAFAVARYLCNNTRGVAAHAVVGEDVVWQLADYRTEATGHAGIMTRIPGTLVRDGQVNNMTVGIEIHNIARKRPSDDTMRTAVELVVDMIHALQLPDAGVVLGHREVTVPDWRGYKRRTDPTGVDMEWFRREVESRL